MSAGCSCRIGEAGQCGVCREFAAMLDNLGVTKHGAKANPVKNRRDKNRRILPSACIFIIIGYSTDTDKEFLV